MRPRHLTAPDDLHEGRPGAVRQYDRTRPRPKIETDPALARDGRPAPRQHPGPRSGPGSRLDGRAAVLLADRAYDIDALRAWLARQGIETVIRPEPGARTPNPDSR